MSSILTGDSGESFDDSAFVMDKVARRVATRYLIARDFSSPEELQNYLHDHPGADKSKHHVKKKDDGAKSKSKDQGKGDSDGLGALKGLSPGQRKRVLEQAIENNDAESKGRAPKRLKDLSKGEGFEALKDLSHAEQKRVVEKALKDL